MELNGGPEPCARQIRKMYPASFDYVVPQNLKEAIDLSSQYGEDAKFLAGGQSLVPLMKLRLVRPKYLIDLNVLPDLNEIKEENGSVVCGAMTRHVQFTESELLKSQIPLIPEAASHIGDTQIRNRGTLGGALVEADPAGDWGAVILALNAQLKCIGPEGERSLEAKEFFEFAYSTKLKGNEVLSAISFPVPVEGSVGAYAKLERVSGDFAIASVALQIKIDAGDTCRAIGIGLGGVGVTPRKPVFLEAFLLGNQIGPGVLDEACRLLDDELDPLSDQRGPADYKRQVVKVLFRRSLTNLWQRSKAQRV